MVIIGKYSIVSSKNSQINHRKYVLKNGGLCYTMIGFFSGWSGLVMAKDILAFFGLLFLTLLIVIGVGLVGYFYDDLGILRVSERIREEIGGWTEPGELVVTDFDLGEVEWSNPLDAMPVLPEMPATAEVPTLVPTFTPIPPLKPGVYRVEVVLRLKEFVAAIEHWLFVNKEVAGDEKLVEDPGWQNRAQNAIDSVLLAARVLDDVGPPPAGYEAVDERLARLYQETQLLHDAYSHGLSQHAKGASGSEQFRSAGESFTRVKEYLAGAVEEMLALGWSLE
jgi:hypothetical protein